MIAKITQKDESPVESPRIFGPIMLPSTCCKISIKISRYRPCIGSVIVTIITQGTAPISGPKNGITFVTPTITLTSSVYGIFRIQQPIKQMIPMMIESMILPIIKPPKISSIRCAVCTSIFACLVGTIAKIIFFA